ncbi:MAG: hypothetical protein JSR55_04930 [Proteobacteria bacterium]|nr:hypothetical protein [Pseudomonadota bacterium]
MLDTVTVPPYILSNSGIAPRPKASRKTRGAFGFFGQRFRARFLPRLGGGTAAKLKERKMPLISDPAVAAENAARRAQKKLNPEDIDSDWLDDMVKRLFNELDRQMKQVEDSRTGSADAQGRAANARTLASLERTLERLSRTERERAAQRTSKALTKDGNRRAEIERKIARIIGIEFESSDLKGTSG